MGELSGRGSRRPSRGTDEREGNVAAEGGVQERWLRQRSLGRQKSEIKEEKERREKKGKTRGGFSEKEEGTTL